LTTAAVHPRILAYAFLPKAFRLRLTIFPDLLLIRSVFFRPEVVFVLVPLNTTNFASFPLAMTLFFARMARMAARIAARIAFAISGEKIREKLRVCIRRRA